MKQIENEHIQSRDLVTIDHMFDESPNWSPPRRRQIDDDMEDSDESFSVH